MNHEKAREIATYAKLGLNRQHKSRRRRDAVASAGLHRFIGGTDPDRPWIKVAQADYTRVWHEVAAELKLQDHDDATRDVLRPKLEQTVYDRLVVHAEHARTLGSAFQKTHGRAMTAHEREIYARVRKEKSDTTLTAEGRAQRVRSLWARGLMDQIRGRQEGHPHRLQQIWASLVGAEAAMETSLESYDAVRGIAFCRSLSSVRAHTLRRDPSLPAKLSQALHVKISKVLFR
jgi:hypothetical protein